MFVAGLEARVGVQTPEIPPTVTVTKSSLALPKAKEEKQGSEGYGTSTISDSSDAGVQVTVLYSNSS